MGSGLVLRRTGVSCSVGSWSWLLPRHFIPRRVRAPRLRALPNPERPNRYRNSRGGIESRERKPRHPELQKKPTQNQGTFQEHSGLQKEETGNSGFIKRRPDQASAIDKDCAPPWSGELQAWAWLGVLCRPSSLEKVSCQVGQPVSPLPSCPADVVRGFLDQTLLFISRFLLRLALGGPS